jgi:hypothetical protein
MTEDTMAFLDQTQKRGGGDFLKELAEAVVQRLMGFDMKGRIGAGRCERSDERTTQRNGFRERSCDTRLGALELKIPKLRKGSYFPSFSSRARPPSGHWSPSFRRGGFKASRRARSMIWSRRWGRRERRQAAGHSLGRLQRVGLPLDVREMAPPWLQPQSARPRDRRGAILRAPFPPD